MRTPFLLSLAALAALVTPALPARADDGDDALAFKFTAGRYVSSDGNDALDLNLRANQGPNTGWLGFYRDEAGFQQGRAGYERHVDLDWLRTVFSAQLASAGVRVGSITSEVGGDSFAIVGWGRTNLRNYVNLNFDPNDATTLGLGSRALADTELSLFQVRDDRLHTGQRVTHAVWRQHFEGDQRITVDWSRKRGLDSDGTQANDKALTLGYDRKAWFVRFAYDPHAGFGAARQNRLSFGTRF